MTAERFVKITNPANDLKPVYDAGPCYWKDVRGHWMMYFPGCGMADLGGHKIEEHTDGTISVSPSILVEGFESGEKIIRHGFLTRGLWTEC